MSAEEKITEAMNMDTLRSRVPDLLKKKGLTALDLVRLGVSYNMAYRVARGYTNFKLYTAWMLVKALGLKSLDDLFEYVQTEEKGH